MSDIWTKLNSEWEGDEIGVIAQTNCDTEEGSPICDYFRVQVSTVLTVYSMICGMLENIMAKDG
jgi:hypothetical protein